MLDVAPPETAHLDAFHDLLPTLARALDVRDVFRHLSAVADRIVPHDEANLALVTDDHSRFQMFASTGDGAPALLCREDRCILRDLSHPRLFSPGAGFARGLASGVSAPVNIDGAPIGVLALLSRRPDAYSTGHLALVQRLADHVAVALAHQRLAEAARLAAVERERAANVEGSVELLRAISGVLDIRTVFPRVSEITSKILPHDRMTMAFYDGENVVVEAASAPLPLRADSRRRGGCRRLSAMRAGSNRLSPLMPPNVFPSGLMSSRDWMNCAEDGSSNSSAARTIADRTTTLIHPSAEIDPLPTFTRTDLGS